MVGVREDGHAAKEGMVPRMPQQPYVAGGFASSVVGFGFWLRERPGPPVRQCAGGLRGSEAAEWCSTPSLTRRWLPG